jgi:hypothetical protein
MPTIPRPGVPVLRELTKTEDDFPTEAGARSTKRPPSIHDADDDTTLGKVMAAVSRLEAKFASLQASWSVRSQEHVTGMRELTELGRCVEDMRDEMRKAGKRVSVAAKLAPGVIVLVEIARAVANHYLGGN